MLYDISIDGKNYRLELERMEGSWLCRLDGREVQIDAVLPDMMCSPFCWKAGTTKSNVKVLLQRRTCGLAAQVMLSKSATLDLYAPKRKAGDESGPRKLVASMPGKVVRVLVSENTTVEAGQGIIVVEAMKMQNEIKSPKKGVLRKLITVEGANVNAGDVLAIVE